MKFIIPSIDIMDGKAVRLRQGKEETERELGNPLQLAQKYEETGFQYLHIVDLDSAFGKKSQSGALKEIRKECPKIKIQWAGGIRSFEAAEQAFSAGADRVVFGTALFKSSNEVLRCSREFGAERTCAALDFSGSPPVARIAGWKQSASAGLKEAIVAAEGCKVGSILLSSVDRDGMQRGPDFELLSNSLKLTKKPIWLAGGVRDASDAQKAFRLGAQGVVFGTALYSNSTDLGELLCLQKE